MGDFPESACRLTAAYRGRKPDRVPICSPISWQPMQDVDREKPTGWRGEPGFVEVARLVQRYCDPRPPFSPVARPPVGSSIGYQRFLDAPEEFVEALPPERIGPARTRRSTVLHTPRGDLHWAYDADDGIETAWDVRKPIAGPADVEAMLSVPWRLVHAPASQFDAGRAHRRELGSNCIAGASVNSMVAMLCAMMPFQLLLEWALVEKTLVRLLADAWLARTLARVDFLLDQGVGPVWHFNGVERATPPMMGPRQWEEWVVPYDGAVMRRIKSRDPEAIIHVHCHGRVGTVLESMLAMGVDSTDPVEPPPQGDISLAEARRIVGSRMTLFGNIEFLDMETLPPDEIERKVREAIDQAGRIRTVLYPSATPHERHSPQLLANAVRFIEAGLKYGTN
jgi:hypothetical protein